MKKRIVALILTVVMSLLALVSCGSFDFIEEDLTSYATFDADKFMEALQKLEIEDGEFTTDVAIRELLVDAKIYNTIVDKIIAKTSEDEQVKSGELGAGDVLYFVYFATYTTEDGKTHTFFGSDMNESTITASSTKANHVVKLDDYFDEDEEFFKLLVENLQNVDIKDYVYSMLTKAEIEAEAEKALKETKPDATADEIKAKKAEAIKVKAGDKLYISYTVSHSEKNAEGVVTTVKEKASYELITLDAENAFHSQILNATSANVGETVTTKDPIKVTVDEVEHTYTDVKVLWKVDSEGKEIATFEYTPYEKTEGKDDEKKEVTPDSLYTTSGKIDLIGKALTYHVYPVYAIDAPAYEEITATDILYYVNGSSLADKSYEAFEGVTGLEDLLKDVKSIFATTEKDNKFYAEGTELAKLLKAYNDLGGANPTTEQKTANTEAKEALTDGQNAELKKVCEKIAALNDGKLGTAVLEEYEKNTLHSLKEEYDSTIVKNVRSAILDLIYESVKVTSYPEKLLKEYVDHLYESYEYTYYTGDFDKTTSNVKKYADFNAYLEATLKVSGEDKINEAIEKEAKAAIEPIIKIYVVSKALEEKAVAAMVGPNGYIEADITGGAYYLNEEEYRDYYGDKADKKIAEAKKNIEENIKSAREESGLFLINDAYMRKYKKAVGSAFYRQQVESYGEINLRTALQFNKLFYYLTCTEIELNAEEGHAEVKYTADGTKIDFRTVDYVIVEK